MLRTDVLYNSQILSATGPTPQTKALLEVFPTFAHRCSSALGMI